MNTTIMGRLSQITPQQLADFEPKREVTDREREFVIMTLNTPQRQLFVLQQEAERRIAETLQEHLCYSIEAARNNLDELLGRLQSANPDFEELRQIGAHFKMPKTDGPDYDPTDEVLCGAIENDVVARHIAEGNDLFTENDPKSFDIVVCNGWQVLALPKRRQRGFDIPDDHPLAQMLAQRFGAGIGRVNVAVCGDGMMPLDDEDLAEILGHAFAGGPMGG